MKQMSLNQICGVCCNVPLKENHKISKAFTLIEIIFTIIIMAGIFMVIPKIIMAATKNESFAAKQDAFFNAASLIKTASSLAWDENNTENLGILKTALNNIECNSSTDFIRIGSFLSANARTCKDNLQASAIQSEEGSDYLNFDDIDDFNGMHIDVTAKGEKKYLISTDVIYLKNIGWIGSPKKLTIDLGAAQPSNSTSNIKKLTTTIKYNGKKSIDHNKTIAAFTYYSANIGQFTLAKREW